MVDKLVTLPRPEKNTRTFRIATAPSDRNTDIAWTLLTFTVLHGQTWHKGKDSSRINTRVASLW